MPPVFPTPMPCVFECGDLCLSIFVCIILKMTLYACFELKKEDQDKPNLPIHGENIFKESLSCRCDRECFEN